MNELIVEMLISSTSNISLNLAIEEFKKRYPGNYEIIPHYKAEVFDDFEIKFQNFEEEIQWKLRWT